MEDFISSLAEEGLGHGLPNPMMLINGFRLTLEKWQRYKWWPLREDKNITNG
jgi:hypothetical protein